MECLLPCSSAGGLLSRTLASRSWVSEDVAEVPVEATHPLDKTVVRGWPAGLANLPLVSLVGPGSVWSWLDPPLEILSGGREILTL